MSSQLKEKQQQKDNKRDLDADSLFNQHLFRTLAYSGAGFGAGLVASVFFKHRKALTLLGAGSGAAYGASNFMNELNQFGRYKEYANQSQQPHTLKREDQLSTKNWEDFMPKQESLSQQKRFGGSGDDDEKGSKPNPESRTRDENKSNEKKGHEATATKPKTQAKSPSESLYSTPTGSKESPSLNAKSSHDKTMDKSSYDFGKGKGESSKTSTGHREGDKSSHQSESKKSDSPKTFSTSHKESDKSSHDQQKSESSKNLSQGKEQQKSGSSSFESKSDNKEQGQGQHLQDFKTNKGAGKPDAGDSRIYRGAERDVPSNPKFDYFKSEQNRIEQDRLGKHSTHTGNKMKMEHPPENIAGGQFSGKGLTAGSQTNAVIE